MEPITFSEYLGRYYNAVGPNAHSDPTIQALIKADDRYDFLSTDYFNPKYSANITL